MKPEMRKTSKPKISTLILLMTLLVLLGCEQSQEPVQDLSPQQVTVDDLGYYCNMIVAYHPGPKAQILLSKRDKAIWFSSVRDAVAFTMLPDEPKTIAAIYVTAMDQVEWEHPENEMDNWIVAKDAWFVIGSEKRGGMGQLEAVPFRSSASAEQFSQAHGGRVVAFSEIPKDYIMNSTE